MKVVVRMLMRFCMLSVVIGLVACSSLPELPEMNVFPDQKDDYKKSHELPSLEMPPELAGNAIKDEYDGAARETKSASQNQSTATTYALEKSMPKADLLASDGFTYLLLRESMRNAWRMTVSGLNELDYEIADKNRIEGMIYLEIPEDSEGGMLSSLSFWGSSDTTPYVLSLKDVDEGIAIRVMDENKKAVDDEASKLIYADLLDYLTK